MLQNMWLLPYSSEEKHPIKYRPKTQKKQSIIIFETRNCKNNVDYQLDIYYSNKKLYFKASLLKKGF